MTTSGEQRISTTSVDAIDNRGSIDLDRLAVPLSNAEGEIKAICAAMPFLHLSDLPPTDETSEQDPLIQGVRQVYSQVLAGVAAKLEPGQSLIVTGHCYMTGGEISELSERRILGGNQHALPVDIFPEDVTYVALGHLHKAQRVGGRDRVRYSGSPLPLSVTEREYQHQVLLVDVNGPDATITPLPVPRFVQVVRVPARGAASPDKALAALRALEAATDQPRELWPYLHVAVSSAGPIPGFRRDVEEALAGKNLRLARIDKVDERPAATLAAGVLPDLEDVQPEEVFVRCWRAKHDSEPTEDYLAAFRQLLEGLESGGEMPA